MTNIKLSKVVIYLKSRQKLEFLIKSKDKNVVVESLIKAHDFHIYEYDFVVFDAIHGKTVVNRSQIEAFQIKDVNNTEYRMED